MPSSIETRLAPMFGMIAVSENGLTRSGPRSSKVSHVSSNDLRPPIAVPKETPTRSHSGSISSPASCLRLPRSRHDHLREPVHAPRLLALDPLRRIEALRLAGERDRKAGGVERRDRAGRRSTCDEILPTRAHIVPQRRHRAEPRDHDSPMPDGSHQLSMSLSRPSDTERRVPSENLSSENPHSRQT